MTNKVQKDQKIRSRIKMKNVRAERAGKAETTRNGPPKCINWNLETVYHKVEITNK